ncbi:MAG: ribonuclease HII [Clostridia bacterium]|nr:ribonuclease HII [Clostridia bacterium]
MSKKEAPTVDMLAYEKKWQEKGYALVAGIDEAGRGPLAGPVSAACVVMPLDDLVPGVNDSKKLTAAKREKLYPLIMEKAIAYSIVTVDAPTIDEINILNATKLAMRSCVEQLAVQPDVVLVDAVKLDCGYPVDPIIKGDALSYSIACASVLAKVYRDHMMVEAAKEYPAYGFEQHKGYGTAAHIAALQQNGPCPLHRRSFIGHFVDLDE